MPRYILDVTNSNRLGKNSNLFKPREDMLWQRHGNCHDYWMATPNGTASFPLAPSGWVSLPRCMHQHTAGHPDVF